MGSGFSKKKKANVDKQVAKPKEQQKSSKKPSKQEDSDDEKGTSDYGSDDEGNADIDYELLSRVILNTFETVDSEDEEDNTTTTTPKLQPILENNGSDHPTFQPNFAEFPSHKTLRQENERYWQWRDKHSVTPDDPTAPEPPRHSKAELFHLDKFAAIDKYALEAPRKLLNHPVDDVVKYLTKPCKGDLQKARVIFRWCCAQNLSQLPQGGPGGTILQRLWDIKNDQGSYGTLYLDMCSSAALQCKEIYGAAKAATYELGNEIDFVNNRNNWTVVRIDNDWRLVDLNFAARKQTGGSQGEWELLDDNGQGYSKVDDAPIGLTYTVDNFYFLTDPEDFIYNHYPEDEQWQLLARTITKDEYRDLAYLRSSFFELDLDVRAARRCVVHAPSGETIFKFGVPRDSPRRFMYHLWKSSRDGVSAETIQGQKLSQFVYMEQRDGVLICKVTFPLSGKYKFQLFARDSGKQQEDSTYSWAADYLIMCTKRRVNYTAMPTNQRQEWGPGQDIADLGLIPVSHPGGKVEAENGLVTIKFKMPKPVELLAGLRDSDEKNDKLERWTIHREENGEAVINLRLQNKGTYALDIYGKLEGQDGTFPLVCTYLVNAADGVIDQQQFPEVTNQKTGATNEGKKLSLVAESHKHSYFHSEQGQEDIVFGYSTPLEFIFDLHHFSHDGAKTAVENHIFIQQTKNKVTFNTRFPTAGLYLMNIYAKKKGAQGSYSCVYQYVVQVVNPMPGCLPFPKLYPQWGEGCEVQGLGDGVVEGGDEFEVTASIPYATGVVLIGDGPWTYLQQNTEGQWQGKVKTGEGGHTMKLSACYQEGSNSYSTLAEYQVTSKEDLVTIEEKRKEEAKLEEERKRNEEEMKRKKEEQFQKIKKQLQAAIISKDIHGLRAAVKLVEKKSYTNRLKEEYNTARNLIKSLERVAKLQKTILKMNQGVMAEIRSYPQPPQAVHQVMVAALLVLRENENTTSDWKKCQALCNTNNLKKLVNGFKVHDLHPEVASRAKQILQSFRLEEVAEISSGAACFYAWIIGMCEELNILKKGGVKNSRPADVKRQKQIFSGKG